MHCPFCKHGDTRVLDSRVADDGTSIRRRRVCSECEKRFTTIEQMQLTVLKRSGASEPFSRDKAISGVRKALKGRPVTEDALAVLGQDVEDALRAAGSAEIASHEVKSFESVNDFADEIAGLMAADADQELQRATGGRVGPEGRIETTETTSTTSDFNN